MIQPIELQEQQVNKLLEMVNTLYGEFYEGFNYQFSFVGFIKRNNPHLPNIHWYELLINHLVPSIYQFGLEEFCLNIECHLEGTLNQHLVDVVYERFEQHIKNIIEK
jgi:hypothetical protein